MVKKAGNVPDAWEDDWETQADNPVPEESATSEAKTAPLTKKERMAQHAESNRKLWESAEASTQAPLQYQTEVPLSQTFRGPMKVLARKPAPKVMSKRDPVTGLASLSVQDDSDDEQEDKTQETPEEIRARQQRELEERQRRYDEVRAKIFGEGGGAAKGRSNPSSGASTPGTVTPPRQGEGGRRGRGRGRGAFRGGAERGGSGASLSPAPDRSIAQPAEVLGRGQNRERELFDPNYSPKPSSTVDKRGGHAGGAAPSSGRPAPREEDQAVRQPRGPDAGDRGGFGGFARRETSGS